MPKLRNLVWSAAALAIVGCKQQPPAPAQAPRAGVHSAQAVGQTSGANGPSTASVAADAGSTQAASAPQGPTGTIEGVATFLGKPPPLPPLPSATDPACQGAAQQDRGEAVHDGKLADVLVRIDDPSLKGPAPAGPVVVNQQHCMYTPRVQGAVVGQKLEIRNEDPTLHNVHTYEGHTSLFNNAQPPGAPAILKPLPAEPGEVQVKCDIHEWMLAYVWVSPNPYFAVSDATGQFRIPHVPPGHYTLQAWSERFGTRSATVDVKPNQTAQVHFQFNAPPAK